MGDIVVLNLLILVCSMPVVTAGAAWAATWRSCFDMRLNADTKLARTFLRTLRASFVRVTPVWIGLLGLGTLVVWEVHISGLLRAKVLGILMSALALAVLFISALAFFWFTFLLGLEQHRLGLGGTVGPNSSSEIISEGGTVPALKLALVLAVKHLPLGVFVLATYALPGVVVLWNPMVAVYAAPIWFFFYFGALSYVTCLISPKDLTY